MNTILAGQRPFDPEFLSRLQARAEQLARLDPSNPRSIALHETRTADALVAALGGDLGERFAEALGAVRRATQLGYFTISANVITPGNTVGLPRDGYIEFPREAYPVLCTLTRILGTLAGVTAALAAIALIAVAAGAIFAPPLLAALEAIGPLLLVAMVAGIALGVSYLEPMHTFCVEAVEPLRLVWHDGGAPKFLRDPTAGFAE
jgi:hypothetical protein